MTCFAPFPFQPNTHSYSYLFCSYNIVKAVNDEQKDLWLVKQICSAVSRCSQQAARRGSRRGVGKVTQYLWNNSLLCLVFWNCHELKHAPITYMTIMAALQRCHRAARSVAKNRIQCYKECLRKIKPDRQLNLITGSFSPRKSLVIKINISISNQPFKYMERTCS